MDPALLIYAVAGAIGGGGAVLAITMLASLPDCPGCGQKVPRFRKPSSARQAMWGGWTCPNCGCQMNRKGRRLGEG